MNIKGQETGRKVTLNDAIFGIEPNDHVIYLDVSSISLTSVRVRLRLRSVQSMQVLPASWVARRAAAVLVMVISIHLC